MGEKIAVVGLGYVGLPVAMAMAKEFDTIGLDINLERINQLKAGFDATGEIDEVEFEDSSIVFGSPWEGGYHNYLSDRTFIIVAVPTPIDSDNRPDLTPLIKASESIGPHLQPGTVVVYESTVYPGVTEEVCGPILEKSGLLNRKDFFLGYSPERINPGDKEHSFASIVKIVSGQDETTLNRVAEVYSKVVKAGVYRAPSIRVAEAAKVIENTQRDLNIALMNEFAQIFDRMGIRTADVIKAAQTKWNFLPFAPGLVGGHCIGVDPYYLASKAESLGYRPEVILAGRRINNSVGSFIGNKAVKLLSTIGVAPANAKVGILGLTFKENVPDLRNSKVPDIVTELSEYGIQAIVHDPLANPEEAKAEYGIRLASWDELKSLDVLIYAVKHNFYQGIGLELFRWLKPGGVFMDIKSSLNSHEVKKVREQGYTYWSL